MKKEAYNATMQHFFRTYVPVSVRRALGAGWRIFLDAVFPAHQAENELFTFSAEQALAILPPAPALPLADIGTNAFSVFAYKDERIRRMIWAIKYKRDVRAVEIAAHAILAKLAKLEISTESRKHFILIPIPISARRRRERGYNQIEILADKIIEMLQHNTGSNNYSLFELSVVNDLLVRSQHRTRQTTKDRAHRLEDARGIFEINMQRWAELKSTLSHPNTVVVVLDDVITTGSTLKSALDTIKAADLADSSRIVGLSVAH